MTEVASNPLKKVLAAEKKHWSTVRRHVQLQLMIAALNKTNLPPPNDIYFTYFSRKSAYFSSIILDAQKHLFFPKLC